jgi:hypothetical protein
MKLETKENMCLETLSQVVSSDIKRGFLYWSLIPYTIGRPIKIIKNSHVSDGNVVRKELQLIEEPKEFSQDFYFEKVVDSVNRKSKELDVIQRHKARMVIVMQDDAFNEDVKNHFLYVLPIQSLNPENKNQQYIENIINNKIPSFHYLGNLTGKDAYVNVSDMKRIHKTLLIEKVEGEFNPIPEYLIDEISVKFLNLLGMNHIIKDEYNIEESTN